ncbi:MAG: carbamate kinase [Bacteroidales bacterium]|nr:carbamate kinase [Bacteroidales bacterium]
MKKLAVIAFGGNALLRGGQRGTYREQMQNVTETCQSLLPFLKNDYNLVIGHGNGPQVGNVMLQNEAGNQVFNVPDMPIDFCVAETQGLIGFMIEMGLDKVFAKEGMKRNVVTLVTQVIVDKDDPMFQNPTKPVGPYYTKEQAEQYAAETGAVYKEDPKGRGWRKVVASPKPIGIQNIDIVKRLANEGNIVVTVGGGGIPVIEKKGCLCGVEAVIDKDLASAMTAIQIQADEFYILTDVPKVYINFRKENEQALNTITVAEAKKHLADGQFTEGSMAPKVRAAILFVEATGHQAIITEATSLTDPTCGTRIVP